jgi:hypothetical protein
VGDSAGNGITTIDNNIIIGHLYDVRSVFRQVSNRCFIDNIYGVPISILTSARRFRWKIGHDSDRWTRTGVDFLAYPPRVKPFPKAPSKRCSNFKVEKVQATVMQQQKQIQTLTASSKSRPRRSKK